MSDVQGTNTGSLLQLGDEMEHVRLRAHLNAFFTPDNVDAVYSLLRSTAVARAAALSDLRSAKVGVEVATGRSAHEIKVDGFAFARSLISEVVMQVPPRS